MQNPNKARNLRELWQQLEVEWDSEEYYDIIRKVYESMPRRVADVIEAKGGQTKW